MQSVKWFDSNICVGRPMNADWLPTVSIGELRRALEEHSVAEGLIWHIAQCEAEPYRGNDLLESWLRPDEGIIGCLAMLPTFVDVFPHKKLFKYMKEKGFRAVRIFPARNNCCISAFKADSTMDEIVERRIPIILSLDFGANWSILAEFLCTYPKAVCIVSDIGVWGQDRYLQPLMEKYSGLHAETSMLSLEAEGLPSGLEKFGASRFVFGSGFPRHYIGAPMAELMSCEISDKEKSDVAGGNMRRLIGRAEL